MPVRKRKEVLTLDETVAKVDSIMSLENNRVKVISSALTKARQMKNHLLTQDVNTDNLELETRRYGYEKHKKYALALACLAMFFIGAPLGAIVKKGGLGVPVLFSIIFYILFYILNITGGKMSKQDVIDPWVGAWMANFVLFPIGFFFLRQARIDARIFEVDFYHVIIEKLKRKFNKKGEDNMHTETPQT
jgi:lipopolysaccharide export system permease protein